jgi:nucleoid DNA-binding protein
MDTELAGRRHISRVQARAVVNEVFKIIAEALQNREVVRLPVGEIR